MQGSSLTVERSFASPVDCFRQCDGNLFFTDLVHLGTAVVQQGFDRCRSGPFEIPKNQGGVINPPLTRCGSTDAQKGTLKVSKVGFEGQQQSLSGLQGRQPARDSNGVVGKLNLTAWPPGRKVAWETCCAGDGAPQLSTLCNWLRGMALTTEGVNKRLKAPQLSHPLAIPDVLTIVPWGMFSLSDGPNRRCGHSNTSHVLMTASALF